MTDIENKTEKSAAKDTADTAPYMKKDNTPESSKSNIVIPLILLIVAVIVIAATFYKTEYSNMIAEKSADADPAEISSNELATVEIDDKTNVRVIELQSNDAGAASEETTILVAETSSEPATDTATTDEGSEAQQQPDNDILTMQSQPVNNYGRSQPAYRPYPYHPGMQNPAKSHTQEQAQKYNEVMQQRRQAYEKEMEARRQQYEETMKAQQKKREAMIATQKVEFQRMEEKRLETDKKIQEIHNQISELHKQIHQLKLELYPARINPAAE